MTIIANLSIDPGISWPSQQIFMATLTHGHDETMNASKFGAGMC